MLAIIFDLSSQEPRPQIHSPVLIFRTYNFVDKCNEELTIIISRKRRLTPVRNGFRLDGNDIYMHVHINNVVWELSRSDKKHVRTLVCGKENWFQRGIGSFPGIYQGILISLRYVYARVPTCGSVNQPIQYWQDKVHTLTETVFQGTREAVWTFPRKLDPQ